MNHIRGRDVCADKPVKVYINIENRLIAYQYSGIILLQRQEPMFITRNGHGDLAVMSINTYERFCGRYELYHLLNESLESKENGEDMDYDEFIAELRTEMS